MRGCESCRWWTKWKNDPLATRYWGNKRSKGTPIGGLCGLLDGRCSTSTKFNCEYFRGKRYNKKRERRMSDKQKPTRNWKEYRKTQYRPT